MDQMGSIQKTGVRFPSGSEILHMDYLIELVSHKTTQQV